MRRCSLLDGIGLGFRNALSYAPTTADRGLQIAPPRRLVAAPAASRKSAGTLRPRVCAIRATSARHCHEMPRGRQLLMALADVLVKRATSLVPPRWVMRSECVRTGASQDVKSTLPPRLEYPQQTFSEIAVNYLLVFVPSGFYCAESRNSRARVLYGSNVAVIFSPAWGLAPRFCPARA